MVKRVLLIIVGIVVFGGIVFVAMAWRSALPEVEPPDPQTFAEAQVQRGRIMAGIGNCAACHTLESDKPYAGGWPIATEFGTLFGSNITPHPDDGIGRWSLEAFARSMQQGVSRDGSHLYPAFPYTHFTKLTDEDLAALYAYLMTREPIPGAAPPNTLGFPFNVRLLQAGWKLLFFDDAPWQPVPEKTADWNRGAYLVDSAGHCSACHTPRNALGAEKKREAFAGAVVDDWYAPPLTHANPTPVDWNSEELFQYLRDGGSPLLGVATGSMGPVVHDGLVRAPDSDVEALAVYFGDLAQSDSPRNSQSQPAAAIAAAHERMDEVQAGRVDMLLHGAHIYAAACESCHYNSPAPPNVRRPELSLNSAIWATEPLNLIQVTLHGISTDDGLPNVLMPGFAAALSDEDIAALAAYLRATQTTEPAWPDLQQRVSALRQ
ncbi:MAG TPA: c-type cytochrome [Woeseiaceae bacterium]|nr:c-type cytochrome [Woeseiaceae bacterium]